ncbi:MAG: hypothetical protein PHF51_04460 [Candidatus ainarchaeum sp.]|nr:hypothetical protein [Candidatus ainarchaeum sp.]
MPVFNIATRFHPIRLTAFMKNSVELSVEVENKSGEPYWTEFDVTVPEAVSLAPDRQLQRGRLRVGIINSGECLTGKCKVYGSSASYPDLYTLKVTVYGFGRDGAISAREERKVELRCEQLGR